MITKKYLILAVTALLICSAVIFFMQRHAHAGEIYVKAVPIQTAAGWGYNIMAGDKIFIHQEYMPAVTGNQTFKTREDALRVGRLVVERISSNQLPTISQKDLEELGVLKK